MPGSTLVILIGWLVALVVFFIMIIFVRYLNHRERMALISQGIQPQVRQKYRSRGLLRAGLITMMVGVTLMMGLYPLGYILPDNITNAPFHLGPWLLPGLIPLGVGLALVVSYYLEHSSQSVSNNKAERKTPPQEPEEPRTQEKNNEF